MATKKAKSTKVRVIPLGGMNEVGKNMTAIEVNDEIIIIDSGIKFPDDEMYGIDAIIPDITYLSKNKSKVRGIVLTHGHEDHIGGLPYILKELNVPVYGTRLTLGLVQNKLKEHTGLKNVKLQVVKQGQVMKLGAFEIDFIRVSHSIPDAVALAITTPWASSSTPGTSRSTTRPSTARSWTCRPLPSTARRASCCCWRTAPMRSVPATP